MAEVPRNRIMRVTELGPTKRRRAAEFPGQLQPVNNFFGDTLTPELQAKIYFANAVYLNLRIPIKIIWQDNRIVAKHVAFLSDPPTTQPPTSAIPLSIRQGSGSTMLQNDGAFQVPQTSDGHSSATSLSLISLTSTSSTTQQAASATPLSWILLTSTSPATSARHPYNLRNQQAASARHLYNLRNQQAASARHPYILRNLGGSTILQHDGASQVPQSISLNLHSPTQQGVSATSTSASPLLLISQTSTLATQQAVSVTSISLILQTSTLPTQPSASATPFSWILQTSASLSQQATSARHSYNLRNQQAASTRHPYNLRNLGLSTMLQHDGASQVPQTTDTHISLILQTSALSPTQQVDYPIVSLDVRPVQTMSTLVHSTVTNQGAPVINPAAVRSLLDSLWNSISRNPSDVVPLRTVAQPTHSFSAGAVTNEAQSSSYIPHMAQDTSIVQGQIDVSAVHTPPTTAPEGTPINVSEPIRFPPRPSSEIDSDIEALRDQILSREPFLVLREVQLLLDSLLRQFPLRGDPNIMDVPAVSSVSMARFLHAMHAIYPGFTVEEDNNMFFSIPDGEGDVADQLRRLRSLRHEKRR